MNNFAEYRNAIREKSFHPTRAFVEFEKDEVEQSIPARFEKIVRLYPDRLAVTSGGDRSLTYDGLNRAANRIGRAIIALRDEAIEPIALLFENGIDVIAAILGSLKARKFFVALDPSFPFERIIGVLQHSRASLIVTSRDNLKLAQKLAGDARTLLNSDEIDASLSADDLGLPLAPENLASIQYTSGSTGKPKGVAHSHRSQLHTVMINTNEVRLCSQDRLTFLHSIGFTAAQAHLFQSLLNGASLHVFDLRSEGIHGLAKWLKQESLTIYHSPPAVFRQLAEAMPAEEKFSSLRLIRLSGAPVNRLDYDFYAQKFAPTALLQIVMNSTEANVISSFVADETFCFPESGSPVGYPVADKQVLLLDENGFEVAHGEIGEICVKSRYLPPGYLENSAINTMQTRSPAGGSDEATCLTGDLGRLLPDGLLIHLGRKDSMVKIRGHRVELSEIERALQNHPDVKEASVLAWERSPVDKILVAYVVPRGSTAPAIGELHDFLKTRLPDYMTPGRFMFLDSLPLTNGKLDRTALPLPDRRRPELRTPYVQPRNDSEEKVAQLWADVLTLDRVGIHDNFFDLGGHSLAAMRIVNRLGNIFSAEISLTDLFDSPTVAELATVINDKFEAGELASILAEIESLTDEAAQRLLSDRLEKSRG
jgi:amino acid adenylation domain-containing protein